MVSTLITYLTIQYQLGFNVDLTLLSIAIVFPLVFSIRGSFRRREKALQHFSQFRSALKTLSYYISSNDGISEEDKDNLAGLLADISDKVIIHLGSNLECTKEVDACINQVNEYLSDMGEAAPRRLKDRVFKFLNDLHDGFENLHAINIHRTPVSLKAYCLIFIYLFPLIYSPSIIYNTTESATKFSVFFSEFEVYFIVLLTQFMLITLYNIQDQLEYPFDNNGLDDIKVENFRINR